MSGVAFWFGPSFTGEIATETMTWFAVASLGFIVVHFHLSMGSLLISSAPPPEGASRTRGVATRPEEGLGYRKGNSKFGPTSASKQASRSSQRPAVHLWVMFALPSGPAARNTLETSQPSLKSTKQRLAAAPHAPSLSVLLLFLSAVHSMPVFLYQCIR